MAINRNWRNFFLIILLSLFFLLADNPWKFEKIDTPVIGPVWNWLQDSKVHLGLDLQGGTQLDYEIDLREAQSRNSDDNAENDVDIEELISGVQEVIERRVDSLGVAEPKITIEEVGDEKHIVVALPGIKNLDEARERVGKVVQLEFKTQKENISDEEKSDIQKRAQKALDELVTKSSSQFEQASENFESGTRIKLVEASELFADQIQEEIRTVVTTSKENTIHPKLVEAVEQLFYNPDTQQFTESKGFNVIHFEKSGTQLREVPKDAEKFEEVGKSAESYEKFDFVSDEQLADELHDALEEMEKGEVSDVISLNEKYSIVRVTDLQTMSENRGDWKMRAREMFLKLEVEEAYNDSPLALTEIADTMTAEEKAAAENENAEIKKKNEESMKKKLEIEAKNAAIRQRNDLVRQRAKDLLEQMRNAPDEAALISIIRENSESEQAILDANGDTGYFGPGEKLYEGALLDLDTGDVVEEPYETREGIYLVALTDLKKYNEARYAYEMMTVSDEEKANELLRRVREEKVYTFSRLFFSTDPEPWEDTELDGRYFKRADVQYDQATFVPYVSITFNSEGAALFEKLTEENVQKPIAIFVGGELISAPVVQQKISGGSAQITLGERNIQKALQEATELARNLNAGAIPAPLKKPNELNIGSTLGQEALTKSLYAGVIGIVALAIFMLCYYRMMGVLAMLALAVYGLILLFFVQSEIPQFLSAILVLIIWLLTAVKILTSKADGWQKLIFISLSIGGIYFVYSIFITPIVLTLAGVAGVVLSLGMAVDANILIFERMKEEFRLGRSFSGAIETGFARAWSSILDSNMSSLITCAILNYFGTTIIKGFATNLALGILVSMFSAIFVTRTFLHLCEGTWLEKANWIWKWKKN